MIPVFDSLRTPFNVTMSLMYFSGHISNDSQVYVVLKKTAPLKFMLKCTYSLVIQEVAEFVSSSEQIWRNVALHHLLTSGSSGVNGCRQNESPNSWTQYITIIHTTPVLQLAGSHITLQPKTGHPLKLSRVELVSTWMGDLLGKLGCCWKRC